MSRMHYTALERYLQDQVQDADWRYIAPEEMNQIGVRARIIWGWLHRAVADLPEGQGIMVRVPKGEDTLAFANRIRSLLSGLHPHSDYHWSIRQTKDSRALFVMKGELWVEAKARMLLAQQAQP